MKFRCLLLHWAGLAAGAGAVAIAGWRLLTFGAANWLGWICFAVGCALVPAILAAWPEPLVFDREGVLERGSASSRIGWDKLSHVRQYRLRYDQGFVIHSIYGKQLVVSGRIYDCEEVLEFLSEHHPMRLLSLEDELAPISILKADLP